MLDFWLLVLVADGRPSGNSKEDGCLNTLPTATNDRAKSVASVSGSRANDTIAVNAVIACATSAPKKSVGRPNGFARGAKKIGLAGNTFRERKESLKANMEVKMEG